MPDNKALSAIKAGQIGTGHASCAELNVRSEGACLSRRFEEPQSEKHRLSGYIDQSVTYLVRRYNSRQHELHSARLMDADNIARYRRIIQTLNVTSIHELALDDDQVVRFLSADVAMQVKLPG